MSSEHQGAHRSRNLPTVRELGKWESKWLSQLLSSRCSPEEWKVPPTGSLLRFRAPVFLFHSLEQGKQSEASEDLLAAKQPL